MLSLSVHVKANRVASTDDATPDAASDTALVATEVTLQNPGDDEDDEGGQS